MSGGLGFQSSKRRPFHFQKSFHFIDMEMLTCIIFKAFLLLYLIACKTSFLKIICWEWTHFAEPHGTDVGFSTNIYTSSSSFLIKVFWFFLSARYYFQLSWLNTAFSLNKRGHYGGEITASDGITLTLSSHVMIISFLWTICLDIHCWDSDSKTTVLNI